MAEVRRAVRVALAAWSGPFVVACSGGPDSVALAAAVAFEAPARATLVSVDHGLQPGSDVRARAVATLGYELGFAAAHAVRVRVGVGVSVGVGVGDGDGLGVGDGEHAGRRLGGPEAAARTARYAALEAAGGPVLLGHTLDDQAETVLLALGRGSGPTALRGMASTPRRVRPLLGVRRSTTRAACEALGLPVWDDPHNVDVRFRRVRVRHEVLPLLEAVLGGGVAEALARTAEQVRDDTAALDGWASTAATSDVTALAALPAAVRRRVLRDAVGRAGGGPLTAAHLAALDRLITDWHGQGPVHVPGSAVERRSGRLHVMQVTLAAVRPEQA